MRKLSPFATYSRVWSQLRPDDRTEVTNESYLRALAIKEQPFIRSFVAWANADKTSYDGLDGFR